MDAQQDNQRFKVEELFNVKDKGKGLIQAGSLFNADISAVALVTGGGSGIGLMATQALAVNGAKVYVVGRTEEKLDRVAELYGKDISGQIIPLTADVSKKESIAQLYDEFAKREKYLSILINNAGIAGSNQTSRHQDVNDLRKSLFEDPSATVEDWEEVYRINVCQLYFMTAAFLPLLQKGSEEHHGWSSTVLNTSSISGIVKISQNHFNYNTSKSAAVHLTKMLAHEVYASKLKIRINNIAPGVFASEMTTFTSDDKQKSFLPKYDYPDIVAGSEKVPADRPGHERDMGNAILFAVTNQYLNGHTLVVDGGFVLSAGSV